jgi:hypothetical protein
MLALLDRLDALERGSARIVFAMTRSSGRPAPGARPITAA